MRFNDFMLLFGVCLVWGLNIVVTRWVVADAAVPPIFYAGIRFLGIAAVLLAFLRPLPPKSWHAVSCGDGYGRGAFCSALCGS